MSIQYNPENQIFIIDTKDTSYQMQVSSLGHLLHLYYGEKIFGEANDLIEMRDRGFSGNPYEAGIDRTYSLDYLPQEFSTSGTGDYRNSCLRVRYEDGSVDTMLTYKKHVIQSGKYRLKGLPSLYDEEAQEAETVEIYLHDEHRKIEVILLYSVFSEKNIMTRSVRVVNHSNNKIFIEKVLTACFDFLYDKLDFITFYGRHCMERQFQRVPISHGHQHVGSKRGASSHQYNPFIILASPETTENHGSCYGFHLAYSGNFLADVELSQYDSTRFVMGIEPEGFNYPLIPNTAFDAPEVIFTYSKNGFNHLSHQLHDILRNNMIRGIYKHKRSPILINNWEGTYFDFNGEKLLSIAHKASSVGIEMFVLDDGWFGQRNNDYSSLGDWQVNEEKLGMSFEKLVQSMNEEGLLFGLWFEPEMVNEDSCLFREHPEWVLKVPDRNPIRSRHQLVLNFANQEVVDYVYLSIYKILSTYRIHYIKWDFNRSLENIFSHSHVAEDQGRVSHDFVLGLYELLERIYQAFPEVLIESCSGGGGRYDAGMLYYCAQIWTSDNTDAIDRLAIQEGTSYGFPVSTMGSHISVVPNHQTGRSVPLETRCAVAMSGTFGYELDLDTMLAEEYEQVKAQIERYKLFWTLIHHGRYYRLVTAKAAMDFIAWMFVDLDATEALVTVVFLQNHGNPLSRYIKLSGLNPLINYCLNDSEKVYSGSVLMNAGLKLPISHGDYGSALFHLKRIGAN